VTPDHHRRDWIVVILCAVALLASGIGTKVYVDHVNDIADARVALAEKQVALAKDLAVTSAQVCRRQDQVIAVLDHLVSPARQALVQGQRSSNPLLKIDNVLIRQQVHRIEKSPC
jgi:hypothetical protein